ncbi:hypothetical protein [Microbacterium sp.]|uniref:hypothetical protein n=1 Tax=Microbacterium sp. TaxID=51671 RepID=UPI003F9BAB95
MSISLVGSGAGAADDLNPAEGWGEVPEADRPLWSRYMVDHCPWFPGVTVMNFIAGGVMNGGTRAPKIWKDTAADLHRAGFTPMQYYLLAELLSGARKNGDLDESAHGHLFEQWFQGSPTFFRLAAEAWKPWLERLERAESPRRALTHILSPGNVPPLGTLIYKTGEPTRVVSD